MERQEAARLLLARNQARESFFGFSAYMQSSGEPDYLHPPALHHRVMMESLEDLEKGKIRKLMVMMPPGGAKSTYGSVQFSNWSLARNPQHGILAASNIQDLAENFNRRRRNACLTPQWQTLARTTLNKDQMGVGKFSTKLGGFCQAAGVGTAIVGTRSNLNILDDPVLNFEQSMSKNQMDKQWEWFQSDFRSRLVPSGKEVILTTRWSRLDICGRILDEIKKGTEPDWRIIRMPMLADSPDDPLGRELGERLWPEWFTEEMVEVNQRDPQRWMGMYQQIPLNEEGTWVGVDNIQIVDEIPKNLTLVCGVDIALTIGGGDFTVFVVAGVDQYRNLYILDVRREQVDPDVTCERFFQLYEQYPDIQSFYIDDDNASKMIERLMIEKCRNRGITIPIVKMPMRGQDKELRATPLRGLFMQKRVFIRRSSTWNSALVDELMDFPGVDHDDQIDGAGLIARQMPSIPLPQGANLKHPDDARYLVEKHGEGMRLTVPLDDLHKNRNKGKLSIGRRRI